MRLAVSGSIAIAASLLTMPAQAETLALATAPGFAPAFHAVQGNMTIDEHVPRGETVKAWSRMITVQRFAGLGKIPSPGFIAEFAKRYMAACPRSRTSAVVMGLEGGVRIDCPRAAATGQPETVLARAINGPRDMHVVQVSYRTGLLMPKDAQWARQYLGSARVFP
jgi:hypothetical protein